MTDKEYLNYLNERIDQALKECDHYAKSGVLTPEWAVDELYQLTDERNALVRKLKTNDEHIMLVQC